MSFDYEVNSHAYFERAMEEKALYDRGAKHIYYCALEIRSCLERICFEHFYLPQFSAGNKVLSGQQRKQHKPERLLGKLKTHQPHYDRTIDFVNAILDVDGAPFRMFRPDFTLLTSRHGDMGNLLHCFKEPPTATEQARHIATIESTVNDIAPFFERRHTIASISDLHTMAQDIFADFIAGEIDLGQVHTRLQLTKREDLILWKPGS